MQFQEETLDDDDDDDDGGNNISFKLFILYIPSQQTHHTVDTGNYSMDKHNIKSKINYRQGLEKEHINTEKQTNKVIIIILLTQIYPTNGISTLSWWWGLRAPETLRAMPAVA
jgi:hypothetical protein